MYICKEKEAIEQKIRINFAGRLGLPLFLSLLKISGEDLHRNSLSHLGWL